MPAELTGQAQDTAAITLTIPIDGETLSASLFTAVLQALLDTDASLDAQLEAFDMITAEGLTGADDGAGIGAITVSLADGGVATVHLQDASLGTAKIAPAAVDSRTLAEGGTMGESSLMAAAVDSPQLAAASVGTAKIPDNAITTAKIPDNAITTAKIPDNAITTDKIPDNAITTDKIPDDAVTTAKVNRRAVGAQHLAGGSVTPQKLQGSLSAGDVVSVGSGTDFAAAAAAAAPSLGQRIATSWDLQGNLSKGVRGWSLADASNNISVIPSATLGWPESTAALGLPLTPPDLDTVGIWILFNSSPPERRHYDRCFIPWGMTLAAPAWRPAPVRNRSPDRLTAEDAPDVFASGYVLALYSRLHNRFGEQAVIAQKFGSFWAVTCMASGDWPVPVEGSQFVVHWAVI